MLIKKTDVSGLVTTTVLSSKIGIVENKMLDTKWGLVTFTSLNTKIGEVENKMLDVSDLVNKKIITLKYQTLKSSLLIQFMINLWVNYFMQIWRKKN